MEFVVDTPGPGYIDVVGQVAICAKKPTAIAAYAPRIEMHHLTRCVHTSVCTARADDLDGFVGNLRQRLFKTLLYAQPSLLTLPAIVTRAVVFDAERYANVIDR